MAKTKPKLAFRTTLAGEPGTGDIALIEVPADVCAVFGKARPPVVATFIMEAPPPNPREKLSSLRSAPRSSGKYAFRTTIAVYGGKSYIGVRKSHREAGKLAVGQSLRVVVELDDAPRTVTPPKELAAAFAKDAKARAAWDALSFTHQREHAEAIEDAKKPETRARRVAACIALLTKLARLKRRMPTPISKRQRRSIDDDREER